MIDRLTWLHLSDFHFTAGGDEFSQAVACNSLLDDVGRRAAEHGPFAFVLITGDVAFSGQPSEYHRASAFMRDLSQLVSVDAARFFFVPGIHDVDRRIHEYARVGAIRSLSSQQEVDRALGDPALIADLIERQAAFREFVQTFAAGQDRVETQDRLAYVSQLTIEPVRLALMGLNSAWLSGSDGEAVSLVIGERQVLGAIELASDFDPNIVIALAHHPIEWLTPWDQQSTRNKLLPNAHFLHQGHMHQPDVSSSRQCVVVAAGSAHSGRFYPNSYNIVQLDLGAGQSNVCAYTYREDLGRFEPNPPVLNSCEFEGSIPGSSQQLVEVLESFDAEPLRFC